MQKNNENSALTALEEERRRRDGEARRRIAALKAELSAVRAEREAMRFEIEVSPRPSKTKRDLALALGLPLAAAIAVFIAFSFLPPVSTRAKTEPVAPLKKETPIPASVSEPLVAPPAGPPAPTETSASDTSVKSTKAAPPIVKKKPAQHRNGNTRPPKPEKKDKGILFNFEECGDDPICEKLQGKKVIR